MGVRGGPDWCLTPEGSQSDALGRVPHDDRPQSLVDERCQMGARCLFGISQKARACDELERGCSSVGDDFSRIHTQWLTILDEQLTINDRRGDVRATRGVNE